MRNLHFDPRENAPVRKDMTQAERQRLVDLHFERAELRQAESDLNLARAMELGAALRRLRES